MGICVKGARRDFKTEDIIDAAIGMDDGVFNRPFSVIHLRWNRNSNHKCTSYMRTKGFEDVIIERIPGRGLTFDYRKPGSAKWMRNSITGQFTAVLPDTPHNRAVLAAHVRDRLWTIEENDVKRVVEAAAEEIWQDLPKQAKDHETARVAAMHRHRYDPESLNSPPPAIDPKVERDDLVNAKAAIFKEKKELEKEKEKMKVDVQRLEMMLDQAAKNGVMPVQYTEAYLKTLKMTELRNKICRELDIPTELNETKEKIIDKIIATQFGSRPAKMRSRAANDNSGAGDGFGDSITE